ncbi:hypothetical protein E4T49_01796 [Aureobasidium sp. EXF-10728]|nr:hypothetical protein E4T49_01796 [Aureobasidium sp. EXF-10728]
MSTTSTISEAAAAARNAAKDAPQAVKAAAENPRKATQDFLHTPFVRAALPFVNGGVAGMVATSVIQPIDMIKVRLQLAGEGVKTGPKPTPLSITRDIIASGKARDLYTGLSAGLLRQAVYTTARLGFFDTFMATLTKRAKDQGKGIGFAERAVAGLSAGGLAAMVGNPADLALIRMQSDGLKPVAQRANYKSVFDALTRISQKEGVAALWSGAGPTVVRAMALNFGQLAFFSEAKNQLKDTSLSPRTQTLAASAAAGFFASFFSLPFDFVKTRLQKQTKGPNGEVQYKGMFDCFKKVAAEEGPLRFYRGFSTYYVRIAPHAMVTLIVADYLGFITKPPTNELPPYQPLQHPLSAAGRDKLRHLSQPLKFQQNHQLLAEVISCLSEAAAETNEALSSKERALENARSKARNNDDPSTSQQRVQDMEAQFEELQAKVDSMTAQMDKDVRKMIDADNNIEDMQHTLADLVKDVSNASTQRTQRTQRGVEDDTDEEYPDFDPTDPTNATQRPLAVAELFGDRVTRARSAFNNQSLTVRYSRNNHYVNFKRITHEARWQYEEDNAMPPAHLWFKEDRPEHGQTAPGAEDSDDDLQIAKETISTRCPLTLREFEDPVTSRKCPHSFEREAITSMINMPNNHVRSEGAAAVQCPVAGCQKLLTLADVYSDPVIKRKIARVQKATRDADDESDEEGANRPHSIASDDDDDAMDVDETPVQRMKKERLSGRTPGPSAVPASSQRRGRAAVLSIDDDDEDE